MSFSQGVHAGLSLGQAYLSGKDRIKQEKLQTEALRDDRAHNEKVEARAAQQHGVNMRNSEIQYENYKREKARAKTDQDRDDTLLRLSLEAAQMQGQLDGLSREELAAFNRSYLQVFNRQEKDLIDPMGDGREVKRMDMMNGRVTFGVGGGAVQGPNPQPITKGRGTRADGDNEVDSITIEELAANHYGRRQAFLESNPDMEGAFDDPKKIQAVLKYIQGVQQAMTGKADGDLTTRDELLMRDRHATSQRDATQTNALALESARHGNRMKEAGAKGANASKASFNEEEYIAKEFAARRKERDNPSGDNLPISRDDPRYQTDREILAEVRQSADVIQRRDPETRFEEAVSPLREHSANNIKNKTFVKNDDGSVSTVMSGSVNHPQLNGGKPTLIPYIWNGKLVDQAEAVKQAIASGKHWPAFKTHDEATEAAKYLSGSIDVSHMGDDGDDGSPVSPARKAALANKYGFDL